MLFVPLQNTSCAIIVKACAMLSIGDAMLFDRVMGRALQTLDTLPPQVTEPLLK